MVIPTKFGADPKNSGNVEKPPLENVQLDSDPIPVPMLVPVVRSNFDQNDRRWRCLCGCLDVKTGALIIGIFAIFYGIISLFGILCVVPIAALLVYGVYKERHGFIIPYLILTILKILAFFIIFVWGIVLTAKGGPIIDHSDPDPEHQHKPRDYVQDGIIDMAVGLVGFIIQVYFFYVVYWAYKYVSEKNESRAAEATIVQQYGYPVVVTVTEQPANPTVDTMNAAPFGPKFMIVQLHSSGTRPERGCTYYLTLLKLHSAGSSDDSCNHVPDERS